MNAEQAVQGRRVKRRYSAEDRERLMAEYKVSGKTRKAFCAESGINVTTMHGWFKAARKAALGQGKKAKSSKQVLAEVEVASGVQAPIEIALPSGKRLGIYLNGEDKSLIKLIRGVLAC
jgi:transposase-like protein